MYLHTAIRISDMNYLTCKELRSSGDDGPDGNKQDFVSPPAYRYSWLEDTAPRIMFFRSSAADLQE